MLNAKSFRVYEIAHRVYRENLQESAKKVPSRASLHLHLYERVKLRATWDALAQLIQVKEEGIASRGKVKAKNCYTEGTERMRK